MLQVCLVRVHEVEGVTSLHCWGPVRVAHAPEIRNISIVLWIDGVGLFLLLLSWTVVLAGFIRHVEFVRVLII